MIMSHRRRDENPLEITQVDGAGKLCIPPDLAKKLGLQPGNKVILNLQGDILIVKKILETPDSTESFDIQELMRLSENALKTFLDTEPDLYSDTDLKVKYQ